VDAVHIGRYQKSPQYIVQGRGVPDVSMHDEGHHYQSRFENDNGSDRDAKHCNSCHGGQGCQYRFERMETDAGGEIEIQVGVMNPVEAPEQLKLVQHNVLEVMQDIQHQYRAGNGKAAAVQKCC